MEMGAGVSGRNRRVVGDTSGAGTHARPPTAPTMYLPVINPPDAYTARGTVFCGLRTSWLIADTSSSPLTANAICDQKFTVSQFQTGNILAGGNCVNAPCFTHNIAPVPRSASRGQ